MKRFLFIAVCLFLLLFVCSAAYAHSGRTDSDGGHWDRSTGEYHYHHGYSAHDHYDMDGDGILDCPCNFKDKTGSSRSSTNSVSQKSYSIPTTPSSATPKEVEYKVSVWIVLLLILIICLLMISNRRLAKEIYGLIEETQRDKEKMQKDFNDKFACQEQMHSAEKEKMRGYFHAQSIFQEQIYRKSMSELQTKLKTDFESISSYFDDDSLCSLLGAPNGDSIGPDGLPRCEDSTEEKWGRKYTFYANSQSNHAKYHTAECAHRVSSPINVYTVYLLGWLDPCLHCMPKLPDLGWVVQYQKIIKFKEKYIETSSENAFEMALQKAHDECSKLKNELNEKKLTSPSQEWHPKKSECYTLLSKHLKQTESAKNHFRNPTK